MTISADGLITWQVPASAEPGNVNVILTLSDRAGHEQLHTFKIAIARSGL
jgi:hypothetical protein